VPIGTSRERRVVRADFDPAGKVYSPRFAESTRPAKKIQSSGAIFAQVRRDPNTNTGHDLRSEA